MRQIIEPNSQYNQTSFIGGMNLLGDDTRLNSNQYRIGFDLTNRYDVLDPVLASVEDTLIPSGIIQEITTFGNYIILFVGGYAYYRYYTDIVWTQITDFKMDAGAPRYWTVAIPVSTTNYIRYAATYTSGANNYINPAGVINLASITGASEGNLPGLLVQDNINQPQFIFIDGGTGLPTSRITQRFDQWSITFTDATNTVIATNPQNGLPLDNREYVPIGNVMAWNQGILTIVSQDGNYIYRSVSGRPLDFVVNVKNTLSTNAAPYQWTYIDPISGITYQVTVPPFTQVGGGDVTTTAYSVGVGGITCIRAMSTGGWFVSASNANFSLTLNQTPNAPTLFGEYTFNRAFLFNAVCLSDRVIFDTVGDTRFIELYGIRSFNAIQQLQNEGRNSSFSGDIQSAFGSDTNPITQDSLESAAIYFNNYELYAVNTILGPAIIKYDTINNCWVSFDLQQTAGKAVKIFAKIELSILRLFAVTIDNKLYTLYVGPNHTNPSFRSIGICSSILYANQNIKMNNPKSEIQLREFRYIVNKLQKDGNLSFSLFINNRASGMGTQTESLVYNDPDITDSSANNLPDVNTLLFNGLISTPDAEQGWKVFANIGWTEGSFTQFSMQFLDLSPMQPLNSQTPTAQGQ